MIELELLHPQVRHPQSQRWALRQAHVRIGRTEGYEVVLSDPRVSRLHATVRFEHGWYEVAPEGRALVWLNHEPDPLRAPQRLSEGDVLRLAERNTGPELRVHFQYDRERWQSEHTPAPNPIPPELLWLSLAFGLVLIAVVLVLLLV